MKDVNVGDMFACIEDELSSYNIVTGVNKKSETIEIYYNDYRINSTLIGRCTTSADIIRVQFVHFKAKPDKELE